MSITPVLVSISTAVTATCVAFVLSILIARWRHTSGRAVGLLADAVIILPIALPPSVVGVSLLLVLGPDSPVASIARILFTWPATVVAAFAVSFPLMYLSCRGAFQQIDRDLIDLARTYGFSEWRILWRVMVPLGWPGIVSGLLLTFVRALGEFGATLMVAGNIPGKTQTLPLAIYFAFERGDVAASLTLSAISVSMSLLAIILLGLLNQRSE